MGMSNEYGQLSKWLIIHNNWCARIKNSFCCMLIDRPLRNKNCKIQIVSPAIFCVSVFACLIEREREGQRDTYIWLLGIILCPSLYHVTRGRGKEARGGWLMMAARP